MSRGFWRHVRFMDAYVLVLKTTYRGPAYLKLKIEWWVRGQFIGVKQNIRIEVGDLGRWQRLSGIGDMR